MKIQWDYKIDLSKIHTKYSDNKIEFFDYVEQLINEVKKLIEKVTDKDLKLELQDWVDDMGVQEKDEFVVYLDDGDERELEYRLNDLYDIGDYNKRIWFGVM